jgi:hypothetical protein
MSCLKWVTEMQLLRAGMVLLMVVCGTFASAAEAGDGSDYPTLARAEYVFACMASNGRTQQALRQCACSIDVIASVLPYDKYEQAETVLRMRRTGGGYLGEMFRTGMANGMIRSLEEAEAEAEVRCFNG